METITQQKWEFGSSSTARRELFDEIDKFDRGLDPGLSVGRLVSWLEYGGVRADYFVVGIERAYISLKWLPNLAGVDSRVVADGRAMRLAVLRAIHDGDWGRHVQDVIKMRRTTG